MSVTRFRRYDLNLLLLLHVLLQERSVTRAAARLSVTQSAVSRALGRLRDQIGDELLVRAAGTMVPTPRALEMMEPLERMLHELGVMLEPQAEVDPSTLERVFRIGTADHPIAVLMPPLLATLSQTAPGVEVDVVGVGPEVDTELATSELDLALIPKQKSAAGIVWSPVFTDRFVTIARERHPRINKRLTLPRFVAEGHLLITPELRARSGIVDRHLTAEGLERRVVLRVPSFLAAPRVVAQTDLIATLPERVVASPSVSGVRIFTPPLKLPTVTVWMAWHERLRHDPVHAWFRRMVVECAAG